MLTVKTTDCMTTVTDLLYTDNSSTIFEVQESDMTSQEDEISLIYLTSTENKTKETHLRNSSALSAAEISVTVPFGIYKTTTKARSHAKIKNKTKQSQVIPRVSES